MLKRPCLTWWLGAPCMVSMDDKAYTLSFYAIDGIEETCVLEKSEIISISRDSKHAYAGEVIKPGILSSTIMGELFGLGAGALTLLATSKVEPMFENKWFLIIDCVDGGTLELEYDHGKEYSGGMFKQGIATFLKDFKKNRELYAQESDLGARASCDQASAPQTTTSEAMA